MCPVLAAIAGHRRTRLDGTQGLPKTPSSRALTGPETRGRTPSVTQFKHIAVEGVIGVGKTSLVELLAQRLEGRPVFEPVIENPFLVKFYEDRERYAFQTQLYFLLTRYRQQVDLKQPGLFEPLTVCDYLFAKDRMFATLNLSWEELALYNQIYETLDARLPTPDLVIYLQADIEILLDRIKERGLEFEQSIEPEYLSHLSELYNDFFFNYRGSPLLVVQTSGIDFVNNEQDQEWLLKEILSMKGGTKHLIPLGSV